MELIEVKGIEITEQLEAYLEVDTPTVLVFWMYWEPCGDEFMVGKLFSDGTTICSDYDWAVFKSFENLYPEITRKYNLGSSEDPPDYVLLVNRVYHKTFIVPRQTSLKRIAESVGLKIETNAILY